MNVQQGLLSRSSKSIATEQPKDYFAYDIPDDNHYSQSTLYACSKEDEDQISNSYFKLKLGNSNNCRSFNLQGSTRILSMTFLLLFGFLALYAVNIYFDNQCFEDFSTYNCQNGKHPRCLRINWCLNNHKDFYFSLSENFIIFMLWSLVIVLLHEIERPIKLRWKFEKQS